MWDRLRQIVEENDTLASKAFDLSIQALIVLSLVTFSIETLPSLSPRTQKWLYGVEAATVVAFTVEYLLRLALTERKLRFASRFLRAPPVP